MRQLFVEEIYTPSDAELDRRRVYAEFTVPDGLSMEDTFAQAMVAAGWEEYLAVLHIAEDVDLDDFADADFSLSGSTFVVCGDNGEYEFTIKDSPFPRNVAYVVTVNGSPVAVKKFPPNQADLAVYAEKHAVSAAAVAVVVVDA